MTLEPTGERYLPEYDADWTLEHIHRYLLACEYARDKDVLDIACGDGYGSRMLADIAHSVVGVDISQETINHANAKYYHSGLRFLCGSVTAIPLANNSVDLAVSFETIEHLAEHEAMLGELRRVLRPGGLLIISSPDKYQYSDLTGYRNAYHVKELYRREFAELLATHFAHSLMLGQRVVFGSVMAAEQGNFFISWNKGGDRYPSEGLSEAEYNVAFASDEPVPIPPSSVLKISLEQSDKVRNLTQQLREACAREQETLERARRLEIKNDELALHNKALEDDRIELENKLLATYDSRSWRITAPLRHAMSALRCLLGRPIPKVEPHQPVWPPDVCALEQKIFLSANTTPGTLPVGVFLHIYYTELVPEILECVLRLPTTSQIHISTDSETKRDELLQQFRKVGLEARTEIRVCPNRGWDLAPFLVGFADAIFRYPLILRLHSKRSTFIPGKVGEEWRKMLFASLAGSADRVNAIMEGFETNPDLGMVCPPVVSHYANSLSFGGNFAIMRKLLEPYGIHIRPTTRIDFPMGSMFWCRPMVLTPWLEQHFTYESFSLTVEDERDGTLAHALERLFFFGCGITGHTWARIPE